jgi:serine/threonine protein kinase/Tol biopolymer transport system component
MAFMVGTRIASYEIRELLGSGGMGEVYLAHDVRLGRPVALKLLLSELTNHKEHLHRFQQEARATSALNHPNIITIHEVGQSEANHFIATEYVEGLTLRQRMSSGPLETTNVLDIAIQIASGLAVAHAAGIIHRDIKPENVMIRPDGYVKILDFGLAKLAEDALNSGSVSNEITITNIKTNSGVVVGTVSYMSPEQLRGEEVDARTDIWSLGIVLYEMIAGHAPFTGQTIATRIVSILEGNPLPISRDLSEQPVKIERIVRRMLTADREQRYQNIQEVMLDLSQIKRSSSGSWIADSTSSEQGVVPSTVVQGQQARGAWLKAMPMHRLLKHKLVYWLAFTLLMAAVIGVVASYRQPPVKFDSALLQRGQFRKLTATGKAIEAVISSDGKYVAYIVEDTGKHSLWIRQVDVDNNQQIVEAADVLLKGLTFSPDNNFVCYLAFEKNRNLGVLYKIGVLGGIPIKVMEDVDTAVSFSPDGSQFAFVRGYPTERETALMIANADGSNERQLAKRYPPNDFGWRGGPAWSPDGKLIICAAGYSEYKMNLVVIRVEDGSAAEYSSDWLLLGRVAWLKDQSGLLMIAKDRLSTVSQIWYVSYPDFTPRRITNDLNDYNIRSISVSSSAEAIIAVPSGYVSSIWVAPNGNASEAKQITSDRTDGYNGLSLTPDGRVVYASDANGNQDIWITDGITPKQLTSGNHSNYQPCVSPDGRYIIFTSTRSGGQNIWRMNIDGSNLKQLTFRWNAVWPHCSPDGQWVIYKSYESGKRTLWKVSLEGGDPVELSDRHTGLPAISPDSRYIASEYWDERMGSSFQLGIFSFNEGALVRQFAFPPSLPLSRPDVNVMRWKDNHTVTYIGNRGGVSNLWEQSVDGEPASQLTYFTVDRIFWFDWSADGKRLALARGLIISDVVLLRPQPGAADR